MRLTLELDGMTHTITIEGQVLDEQDKLKTMQDVCVLLNNWHTEAMKDNGSSTN
jgi:hypothetical protein